MADTKQSNEFSAHASLLGYLYQIAYALYFSLRSQDEEIFIEKLDDIDFGETKLVQVKHHLSKVSLTDGSDDIWKTIRIWSKNVADGTTSLRQESSFILVTTATANFGSIASLLRDDSNRNYFEACTRLVNYAMSHRSKNECNIFLSLLSQQQRLELVKKIRIIDGSFDIKDIHKKIENEFHIVDLDYRKHVYERLIGWWDTVVKNHLLNESKTPINKSDIESKVSSIADEYRCDTLPLLHVDAICPIDIENDAREQQFPPYPYYFYKHPVVSVFL